MDQLGAFFEMLTTSELGPLKKLSSNGGYDVLVGSTPSRPIYFKSFKDHPRILVTVNDKGLQSTAAGAFQIKESIYDAYKMPLKLVDFGPSAQQAIAKQLIRECKALDDIENGHIEDAIYKCRSRWASLPGAGYDQHENSMASLIAAFVAAGGVTV